MERWIVAAVGSVGRHRSNFLLIGGLKEHNLAQSNWKGFSKFEWVPRQYL